MRKLSVLLVDDNMAFMKAARDAISVLPCIAHIECANSGREALERLGQMNADLVLTDIMMPEMSGFELIRHLSTRAAPPHIVAVTLHDGAEYRAAVRRCGAHDCISKREFGAVIPELIAALASAAAPDGRGGSS